MQQRKGVVLESTKYVITNLWLEIYRVYKEMSLTYHGARPFCSSRDIKTKLISQKF